MKRWLFNQLHQRNLIYNQCWEDPSIDQEALQIAPGDRIVTITSAGCNALDYLLRMPESIDCVDVNPHQTALLELKLAALQRLDYPQFFAMFGRGRIRNHRQLYIDELRPRLHPASQLIWDRHIDYFDPAGRGFYFHGTAGFFARLVNYYIDSRANFRHDLDYFQAIDSLDRQARFYRTTIAPQLWTGPIRWLMRRSAAMSLLGVPVEQMRQMQNDRYSDLGAIVEERVGRTLSTVPMRTNYFWRLYLNGEYTPECCPSYLKAENFEPLRNMAQRIRLHTMTLEGAVLP